MTRDVLRESCYLAFAIVLSLICYAMAVRCGEINSEIRELRELLATDTNVDRFVRSLKQQGYEIGKKKSVGRTND